MPTEKFYYSKGYAWSPFINAAVWGAFAYYNSTRLARIGYHDDFNPWEAVLCVALVIMLIWHFIKYLLPMLQKKLYLELDEEKINFWHKHLIVYEQEIEKVTVGFFGNSVILKLKNKQKVRIYLNGIRGNNGDIAKAIFAFSKTKDAEKLSHYVI